MSPKWMQYAIRMLNFKAEEGRSLVEEAIRKSGIDVSKVSSMVGEGRWSEWGKELKEPIPGCIVVFRNPAKAPQYQSGFYLGEDQFQIRQDVIADDVEGVAKVMTIHPADVLAYRWPSEIPIPAAAQSLLKSGVFRWAGLGIAGFLSLVAENGQYIVSQLVSAEGQLRQGTLISTISATVIIIALVGVLASRAKGKVDENKIQGEA